MGSKILIVDDDLQTLELVGLMLERKGYDVLAERTGLRAIKVAQEKQPDLILLDIMMPGLDGFHVLRRLKRDPVTTEIPIVIFSAKSQTDDQFQCMDAGAIDYVTKPAKSGELVNTIKLTLNTFTKKPKVDNKQTE